MRLSDQSLHGKHVITADGTVIGNVHAVYIDGANLHLDCLAIEVRKDLADRLGVQRSLFHKGIVEIPADQIQFIGQTIILAVPFANLRATAPERTPAHLPEQTQPTPQQPEPRTDGEKPIQPHRPHI
jgi:sporulation protein YlmC with PRC-barrel domain